MTQPPHDLEAETSVLGCCLLAPAIIPSLTTEIRLQPGHFYRDQHRLIFNAAMKLSDRQQPVDVATVANELGAMLPNVGGRDYIENLVALIPNLANAKSYGQIVKEKATLRNLLAATQEIQAEIANNPAAPAEVLEHAYKRIGEVGETEHSGAYTPEDLLELAVHQLTDEPQERFSLGFPQLDEWTNGGMARGQVMVIAAWPNIGKSNIVDTLAESMVRGSERRACLYLSEMTVIERNARFIARNTKLTITETIKGNLSADQLRKMGDYKPPPIHVQPAAGWTVDEVCRDVLRKRWDIVVVDDIENLSLDMRSGKQEAKAEMSRRFNTLAKDNQANCVMLLVSHLSRHGNKDEDPPRPKEAHLRDTQMLAARADICMFLHRELDNLGGKKKETEVYFTRNRTGQSGGSFHTDFDWKHVRFLPQVEVMKF